MNLPNAKEFKMDYYGRELSFTVSDLAGQTNASVIGKYGDTSVLATVVMSDEDSDANFFPLTVNYEERFYAAGKVLGSRFVRREGKPSDFAVLSGRLIDRAIRPLFNDKLRRSIQIVLTVLSYDEENDPDFLALMTASVALSISDIPWEGPVSGIRILGNNGDLKINPINSELEDALEVDKAYDAFFAGTKDKINMIEISGNESQENDLERLFNSAQDEIKKLISFQEEIVKEIGKEKQTVAIVEIDKNLFDEVESFRDKFSEAMFSGEKAERNKKVANVKEELMTRLESMDIDIKNSDLVLEDLLNEIVHKKALEEEQRVDDRKMDEVRELNAEVGLFKRLHGSAFFSRGKTQSLSITTLAPPSAEQIVETIEVAMKRRFMLHYNFPPYSTGETGRMGAPSRREIGHGALAAKALRPIIPSKDEFPYTIRLVSEIVSSNGSSSMASVCAGTLSLMDAGVPIKKPVAGIAMGLMTYQGFNSSSDKNDFKVLTDIQGPEDHYGDMDFKVAGTKDGITAVQMDVKIEGINMNIFKEALQKAKDARILILKKMSEAISEPRKEISEFAPTILKTSVKPEQIGIVIGSGGKVINGIVEQFGLDSVDIDEDGSVFVSGGSKENAEKAIQYIQDITKEYEVGDIVEGKVIKIMDFGAIVDLGGGKDGMVHVSEFKNDFVKDINSVVKEGDTVKAKVIKADNGKLSLSVKALSGGTGK